MNYTLPNPHIDSTLLVRVEIESKGDNDFGGITPLVCFAVSFID